MSDASAVLALPYIQPAQAQKHVTHNEAIRTLDLIVQLTVQDRTRTSAPIAPAIGDRHIVATGAIGAWAGQDNRIALFDLEGWLFTPPLRGWRAEVVAESRSAVFNGTAWVASGDLPQTVTQLGINTTSDTTNRLAISSSASLFNHTGSGHQIKVNKAAVGDTASLLFQTGFSGRAEMGLAGNDDFSIKVSSDGSAFAEGLRVSASGTASLPGGALLPDGTASVPGIRFSADTDTGLHRPGTNQIGLSTGGVQRALLSATSLQIDVPLVGTAVQASSHDATPGRTARTFQTGGMFGFGVAQGESLGTATANANSVSISGLYRTDIATLNLPLAASSGLLEVFHGAGGDTVHQRWSATTADTATRTWQRRASGGTWQAWSLLFGQSTLLGAVAQVSGVPTGAVIERGSNANGEFVRWADGTQICTRTGLSTPNASVAVGSLFRSADVVWTFPVAFVAAPVVKGSVDDLDAWSVSAAPSTASVTLRAMSTVSKASSVGLRATAVGRWF